MENFITVLYVDDEPTNLMLFEINFKKKYKVITAISGDQGIEKLCQNPDIRVVISDMKMPRMNGIEFIRLAKEGYPSIKYFILTGYDITPEIAQALNDSLIDKYFMKPFNYTEIDHAIKNALA